MPSRHEIKETSTGIILLIILSFLILNNIQALKAEPLPTIKAVINVDDTGNATVKITFKTLGKTKILFTLPRFENYTICESYGTPQIVNAPSSAYFYYNSTINLNPGENGTAILSICYKFPYASLLADNQGWFMSPMLVSTPPVNIEVYVKIPNVGKITLESPISTGINVNGYRRYVLAPGTPTVISGRVVIEYLTLSNVTTVDFNTSVRDTTIRVQSPPFYKSLAQRVLTVASKAYANLTSMTGVSLQELVFRFYLPKQSLGGITTLGFVMGEDINAGGRGPIMLNLGLIRYAPGYLETTIIHEMVHAFLGKAGVEANDETRWFHEGLAQYISISVAESLGYNVAELRNDMINASRTLYKYYEGNLSLIQHWPTVPELVGDAYLASFYIIENLSATYNGEAFIKSLFQAIRDYGKVKTTNDIVAVLSIAAGKNLAPLFRSWGFKDIKDWNPPATSKDTTSAPSSSTTFETVVLGIGIAIGVITYFLNEKVQKEIDIARSKSVFEKIEKNAENHSIFWT
ncbi:MAG: hypothetical protein ACP5II_00800 [Infirmifilum sp.]|uniref:hypothetical protein n=1 Tax=Infirmifilum sp. TaxID=2856575 RepID=UPI003D0C8EDD